MLRAGIIGAGAAGRAHARALTAVDDVRLVGVHDPDADQALHLAGAASAEAFADVNELLAAVDVVVVCSPTDLHGEHALRAAVAGVDVLLERPVVARPQELMKLHAAIARAPKRPVVQAGHAALFDPLLRQLLRTLAPHEPALIDLCHLVPKGPGLSPPPSVEELLYDVLSALHPLSRSAPSSVHAASRRRRNAGGLEHVSALIECDDGTIVNLQVGHLAAVPTRTARVTTQTAVVEADAATMTVSLTPRAGLPRTVVAPDPVTVHAEGEDPLVVQARAFLGAVRERGVPGVPLAAALPVLELTEQVLRRAEIGERLGHSGGRRAA
ncbi:Gfo/Idh/MocA family oxidoreductase [Paraconexibacter sp.]|uniref:Gfo/Idh/MocA family oxidoreductase n=1 Tax=Paraconexibacter sp. TaxID=2949640 RepID=UPI003566233F